NAVGFSRRNLMVPEPEFASLAELNAMLLTRCDELAHQDHYRHQVPIQDLVVQDLAACLPLPGVGFDPVRYEPARQNDAATSPWRPTPMPPAPASKAEH